MSQINVKLPNLSAAWIFKQTLLNRHKLCYDTAIFTRFGRVKCFAIQWYRLDYEYNVFPWWFSTQYGFMQKKRYYSALAMEPSLILLGSIYINIYNYASWKLLNNCLVKMGCRAYLYLNCLQVLLLPLNAERGSNQLGILPGNCYERLPC